MNGGSFEDIQNVVDKANSGDTIRLSGTFKASDSKSLIKIDKTLNIVSSSGAVLNARSKSGIFYLDTGAKNSIISGLTFINGKRVIASAIYIDAKKVTLEKCTFRNNHGTDNGGGAVATTYNLNDASGLVVRDCIFKGNSAPASSGALAAFSKNFKIINTVFENNYVSNNMGRTAVGGALIAGRNQQGTYGTISGCTFKNNYVKSDNNEYSRGGAAGIQDNTIVENCKFISNNADAGGAIYCYGSATIKNTNFTSHSKIPWRSNIHNQSRKNNNNQFQFQPKYWRIFCRSDIYTKSRTKHKKIKFQLQQSILRRSNICTKNSHHILF